MTINTLMKPAPATVAALQPYGTLLEAGVDGLAYGDADAKLHFAIDDSCSSDPAVPRFYLMKLDHKPLHITHITRHRKVTQCLAALNGKSWFILLAPPDDVDNADAKPDITRLAAFSISGSQALALKRGTWHAGPYFLEDSINFVNLELSDTNITDHQTINLHREFDLQIQLEVA